MSFPFRPIEIVHDRNPIYTVCISIHLAVHLARIPLIPITINSNKRTHTSDILSNSHPLTVKLIEAPRDVLDVAPQLADGCEPIRVLRTHLCNLPTQRRERLLQPSQQQLVGKRRGRGD